MTTVCAAFLLLLPLLKRRLTFPPPAFSYEALETLGDSFLKIAVSAHLFMSKPCLAEGALSTLRSEKVCNKALFELAHAKDLVRFIITSSFSLPRFHMPGMPTSSSSAAPPGSSWCPTREVADNTLADCVEALIGAYFAIGQIPAALHFMRWLGFDLSGCDLLDHWRSPEEREDEEERHQSLPQPLQGHPNGKGRKTPLFLS